MFHFPWKSFRKMSTFYIDNRRNKSLISQNSKVGISAWQNYTLFISLPFSVLFETIKNLNCIIKIYFFLVRKGSKHLKHVAAMTFIQKMHLHRACFRGAACQANGKWSLQHSWNPPLRQWPWLLYEPHKTWRPHLLLIPTVYCSTGQGLEGQQISHLVT